MLVDLCDFAGSVSEAYRSGLDVNLNPADYLEPQIVGI